MGTHNYYYHVRERDVGEGLIGKNFRFLTMYSTDGTCIEDMCYDDNDPFDDSHISQSFTDVSGCRDLLLQDFMVLNDMYESSSGFNAIIVAAGEQYHSVYRALKGKGACERFMNFMSTILPVGGIQMSKKRFRVHDGSSMKYIPFGSGTVSRGSVERKVTDTIVLRFNETFLEHSDSLSALSALLAILKEPRIVSGILSGDVTDIKSFVSLMVQIAKERSEGKDTSYDCLALWGHYSYNCKTPFDALKVERNDDASDYHSMVLLTLYFLLLNSSIKHTEKGDYGPVEFLIANMNIYGTYKNVTLIDSLRNLYKSFGIDLSFMKNTSEASYLVDHGFYD